MPKRKTALPAAEPLTPKQICEAAGFVYVDADTLKGTLKRGMKLGDTVHREFVMSQSDAGDMFDAEAEAPARNPLAFQAALIARQLVSIGTFEGPFVMGMIRKLDKVDYAVLRLAQEALDYMGEAVSPGPPLP